MNNNESILLVEDDLDLAELICEYLSGFPYQVQHVANGLEAVDIILESNPGLVILDIMLPGLDGMEVCKRVRRDYSGAVLMLTAKDENIDEILGLEIGADDYLTKPVEPRRLLARVKALFRRTNVTQSNELVSSTKPIVISNMEIYENARRVKMDGEDVDLTNPEFDLLMLLIKNEGVVVSRDEMFQGLKGINYDGVNRSVDILISYLRAKLHNPPFIKTIRGKGYLLSLDLII